MVCEYLTRILEVDYLAVPNIGVGTALVADGIRQSKKIGAPIFQ